MNAAETPRCFLALEVSEAVRQKARELQQVLRRTDAVLRLPRPEDLHLTLVFLGETPAAECPPLAELMDGVARFHEPFTLHLKGVSVFGPPARPRVVWAAVKPCPPLMRLQQVLAEGVARLGHAIEVRAFAPHLTLARVDSIGNDRSLTSALASITDSDLGEQPVSRILLMRSGLKSDTSRYTSLHLSPLKGTSAHAPESCQ